MAEVRVPEADELPAAAWRRMEVVPLPEPGELARLLAGWLREVEQQAALDLAAVA